MANSIRTPKIGKSVTSQKIAEAVDDEKWQEFRVSLKGKPTTDKINELHQYWDSNFHGHVIKQSDSDNVFQYDCAYCIRIDNYIKALCRGGQLYPGESLKTALDSAWNLKIKK